MLYEYECDNCGYVFLERLPISDRKIPLENACHKCGEHAIHRIYSTSGIIDGNILKADGRMEQSGVQSALERIRDNVNPNMKWKG